MKTNLEKVITLWTKPPPIYCCIAFTAKSTVIFWQGSTLTGFLTYWTSGPVSPEKHWTRECIHVVISYLLFWNQPVIFLFWNQPVVEHLIGKFEVVFNMDLVLKHVITHSNIVSNCKDILEVIYLFGNLLSLHLNWIKHCKKSNTRSTCLYKNRFGELICLEQIRVLPY